MDKKITIQELLNNRGLNPNDKIKLVRHKDSRRKNDGQEEEKQSLYNLYRHNKNAFLEYQSAQSKPVFHNVDYIVSFIGEESNRARFVGVYKILAELPMDDSHRTCNDDKYYYQMEEVDGFESLKERVIIKWGNAIAWHQWYQNEMEVVEIAPGLCYKQFTDYLDFELSFDELSDIIDKEYPDWKRMLTAVYGVYVICDNKSGKLYIGSAYGENGGIWGRWSEYVRTNGHGNNKTLKELVDADPNYAQNFTFSLVMTMSKSSTKDAVIAKEQLFKRKFGTIANGLNNN